MIIDCDAGLDDAVALYLGARREPWRNLLTKCCIPHTVLLIPG